VSSLTPDEIYSNSHADALIVLEASSASSGRMTGKPDPTCDKDLQLLIDGMEAIDHEAQTNFQKETHHKIRPALARSRTR
jgi:hypothetical protein